MLLMIIKKWFSRTFLVAFIFAVSALAIGTTAELSNWFVWWAADRNPISSVGVITKVYEYRGRHSGRQRISFKEVGGKEIILRSVFDKTLLKEITGSNLQLTIKYYPVPTGRGYIYFLSSSRTILYEGFFRDSGWPGVVVFIACILHYLTVFVLVKCLIKNLRERKLE